MIERSKRIEVEKKTTTIEMRVVGEGKPILFSLPYRQKEYWETLEFQTGPAQWMIDHLETRFSTPNMPNLPIIIPHCPSSYQLLYHLLEKAPWVRGTLVPLDEKTMEITLDPYEEISRMRLTPNCTRIKCMQYYLAHMLYP